jgi:tetratricopeptide (TPR) repeat protein
MFRRLAFCVALALAAPVFAQQPGSMSPDDAYVRSVTFTQAQYAKQSGETAELKALLIVAIAKLKDLETRARANDAIARSTLNDFGNGDTGKGVDALLVQAKAKGETSAAEAKGASEDYKAAGALAFASDTGRAAAAYEAALSLQPDDADALHQLQSLYLRLGRFDEALRLADKQVASSDPSVKTRGMLDRGNVLYKRGDLPGAEAAHQAALAIATKSNLKVRQAQALGDLGNVSWTRGDLVAAEAYQKRALALNAEIGSKEGQAANLGNLGIIVKDRGDLAAAEDYQKRALALNVEIGSKERQAANFGSLGTIAQARGNLADAEDYQKRALALNIELRSKDGQANALNNLGVIAKARGNSIEACDLHRRSLALYESIGAGASRNADVARDNIAKLCPR